MTASILIELVLNNLKAIDGFESAQFLCIIFPNGCKLTDSNSILYAAWIESNVTKNISQTDQFLNDSLSSLIFFHLYYGNIFSLCY